MKSGKKLAKMLILILCRYLLSIIQKREAQQSKQEEKKIRLKKHIA